MPENKKYHFNVPLNQSHERNSGSSVMPTNDRESTRAYMRDYMRMRRFLHRLEHPRKTPGVKPGHKFGLRAPHAPRDHKTEIPSEVLAVKQRFGWE